MAFSCFLTTSGALKKRLVLGGPKILSYMDDVINTFLFTPARFAALCATLPA
jgi:hypothetical protein